MNKYIDNPSDGFSLVEILTVLAIMGITLALAVPSFQSLIASNRLTASANTLVSALQLAKSESVKSNRLVIVSSKNNDWANGWTVFADVNQNNAQDTGEPDIDVFEALNSGYTVKTTPAAVTYRPDGRSNTSASFYLCSPAAMADFRRIIIETTGRVRVETPRTESSSPQKTYATAC